MARDSFVHLHLHTEYSLLDGAVRMRELMNEAVKMKMPAVAITDHGNLFGAIDFYQCAKAVGIKPIIGCEAYITSGSYKEKPSRESTFHFTLLAENETGYRNLVQLISAAHLDGYYYRRRSDHRAHDVLLCINTATKIEDEQRMRYEPELYFKSPAEMREIFRDFPEAIANTLEIADRCNLEIEFGKSKYPEYPVPAGKTREGYLRELCYKGLHERYGERAANDQDLIKRLDYEVDVLEKTGFVSYLLIVWDFIHFARERGIPVGPGRGSAAGSIVAYVLGITDIDPLQYGLIFERFLNPERISPPDIDVDFCEARRGEVLEYVRQKYGERRVAQIITFGRLKARSVVRDVARVMGLSVRDGDRTAKMI